MSKEYPLVSEQDSETLRALVGIINKTGPFRAERSGGRTIDIWLDGPNDPDDVFVLTIRHENDPQAGR